MAERFRAAIRSLRNPSYDMVNSIDLKLLLAQFQAGKLDVESTLGEIKKWAGPSTALTTEAAVDLDRWQRCGFPEVVFCEGKTTSAVVEIFTELRRHGQPFLGTRVSTELATELNRQFPNDHYNAVARTFRSQENVSPPSGSKVAVITAGTSDRPVAEEACETLLWMGCEVDLIVDVGVAGPHRLKEQQHRFRDADVIIVVAGMEGALPSVVGGYVDCPVIAVPTSVGYGASFGGVAALLGMLNSCAANVTVVNIDAGFKGGYVAGLIARRSARRD